MIVDPSLTDTEITARLVALRARLTAEIWPAASEAAVTSDHERVRDLVKLKVDIEAIDFALAHRPKFSGAE